MKNYYQFLLYTITLLFACVFACVYSNNLKCDDALQRQELVALCMGIGSKVLMDALIREQTFKAFGTSTSQPPYTLDDTHKDVARETTEEIARTLLSKLVKQNFEYLLKLIYPNAEALQEVLKKDITTGMLFNPLKNLMFVTEELVTSLTLPPIPMHYSLQATDFPQVIYYQMCSFDSLRFTGNERFVTAVNTQANQANLDKSCLLELQNEIPQLTQLKQEVLEKLLMGLAPFLGAAFAEFSFRIGQSVTLLIARYAKNHAHVPTPEIIQNLIQATTTVFFVEELKMSFNTLVESLIDFSEEKEKMLYLLTRFGEKFYIVLKAVTPAYYKFYITVTSHD